MATCQMRITAITAPISSARGVVSFLNTQSIAAFPRRLAGFASHQRAVLRSSQKSLVVFAHKVEIEHNGETRILEIPEDETILSAAIDAGMDLPHDCKLGVCMTCPAKLVSGVVDQSDGMLSDDVMEAGYALMCAAYPKSDLKIRVIPEEELLSLQLVT
eukprot:TRINITY_DN74228_c0_g1_i2.p1 TRINITY_DN74228_c0_g1~~TRINITY_DN74228_c0_g1_i2.p1  ORF type:complete len:159 (+),score=1.68 TRINITY_DN74228_c0_g1_i2:310-786(+)